MALNPALGMSPRTEKLFPLPIQDEIFIIKVKGIEIVVKLEEKEFCGSGKIFLTNRRIVFIKKGDHKKYKRFFSFELPLHLISTPNFHQPILGANYFEGYVDPLVGSPNPIASRSKWIMKFKKGKCESFLKVFWAVFNCVKLKSNSNPGSLLTEIHRNQAAYIDPNDPSVIFLPNSEFQHDLKYPKDANNIHSACYPRISHNSDCSPSAPSGHTTFNPCPHSNMNQSSTPSNMQQPYSQANMAQGHPSVNVYIPPNVLQAYPPTAMPQGYTNMYAYPQTNMPQGYNPVNMMQEYPPTNMPQGYPMNMPQGFPPTNMPQGFPPTNMPQGYPMNIPQGFSPTNMPQGFSPTNMPQGYPINMPQGFPPTNMPQTYPQANTPQMYPPTSVPQRYPQVNVPQGYPPRNLF